MTDQITTYLHDVQQVRMSQVRNRETYFVRDFVFETENGLRFEFTLYARDPKGLEVGPTDPYNTLGK